MASGQWVSAAGTGAVDTGTSAQNVAPAPGSLSKPTLPCISSASRRQIAKPSPVPPANGRPLVLLERLKQAVPVLWSHPRTGVGHGQPQKLSPSPIRRPVGEDRPHGACGAKWPATEWKRRLSKLHSSHTSW